MSGSFDVELSAYTGPPSADGSAQRTLTVRSLGGYKGNVRIDYRLTGITNGTITPPYTYAFLEEDEVLSGNVTVTGTGMGSLIADGTDGTLTDSDDIPVSV